MGAFLPKIGQHGRRAVAPRWPKDRQGIVIDLTKIDDTHGGFMKLAADEIRKRVDRLYEPGMVSGEEEGRTSLAATRASALVIC
jgi:hypothetical protein